MYHFTLLATETSEISIMNFIFSDVAHALNRQQNLTLRVGKG
jgi:hypothetical protein